MRIPKNGKKFQRFYKQFLGFLRLFVYANFGLLGCLLTRVTERIDAHHHIQ